MYLITAVYKLNKLSLLKRGLSIKKQVPLKN
jgi:hypothetical protein